MRKIMISAVFITAISALTSCKKELKDPLDSEKQTDSTVQVDTAAAKREVDAEKETLTKPYNEEENAQVRLTELINKAKFEGKNVFVQAGGNWCIWCLRFNDFVQKDSELKELVDANYVYYHLNFSTKNKNKEVFDKYAPDSKSLGYPFFFVINGQGTVTKIIASGDLESGKSYDREKVKQLFLENTAKK